MQMNKKAIIIIIIFLISLLAIGYVVIHHTKSKAKTKNTIKFDPISGYKVIKNDKKFMMLARDNKTIIKINKQGYSQTPDELFNKFLESHPNITYTNVSKIDTNVPIKSIAVTNSTNNVTVTTFWYTQNNRTYHLSLNGDDYETVKKIIETTK